MEFWNLILLWLNLKQIDSVWLVFKAFNPSSSLGKVPNQELEAILLFHCKIRIGLIPCPKDELSAALHSSCELCVREKFPDHGSKRTGGASDRYPSLRTVKPWFRDRPTIDCAFGACLAIEWQSDSKVMAAMSKSYASWMQIDLPQRVQITPSESGRCRMES